MDSKKKKIAKVEYKRLEDLMDLLEKECPVCEAFKKLYNVSEDYTCYDVDGNICPAMDRCESFNKARDDFESWINNLIDELEDEFPEFNADE
jgi:hypothetical protein